METREAVSHSVVDQVMRISNGDEGCVIVLGAKTKVNALELIDQAMDDLACRRFHLIHDIETEAREAAFARYLRTGRFD